MTVWAKPISWSKLNLALKCPRQLQHNIDRLEPSNPGTNYHAEIGTLAQKVFELYFNADLNLDPKGKDPKVTQRIADKLLKPSLLDKRNINYPHHLGEDDLIKQVKEDVQLGHELFIRTGLIDKTIRSEVPWRATFRDLRIFSMIDFVVETDKGIIVLDGKGYAKENADPNQIIWNALCIAASGKKVRSGGFLYWRHGYREVDVSPEAIRRFIDETLPIAKPHLDALKKGTPSLPTNPGEACFFCPWRGICPDSTNKREPVSNPHEITLVDFGSEKSE